MSGTKEGGKKAAKSNIEKHGADFYRNIGRIGGRNGHTGGFAANPELAKEAGRKGGKISRRGKAKKTQKREAQEIAQAEEASMKGLAKILGMLRGKKGVQK